MLNNMFNLKLTLEDGPGGGVHLVRWIQACSHKFFYMLAMGDRQVQQILTQSHPTHSLSITSR